MGWSRAAASEPGARGGLGCVRRAGSARRDRPASLIRLTEGNRRLIYFQSADFAQVTAVRAAASAAGVLGSQIFVEHGDPQSIHLADNLADGVWVTPAAVESTSRPEILRVLHPGAKAVLGTETLVKPQPAGVDSWSHPYHGPDNNPSSTDQLARAPFRTQFLAGPLFSPMPEVTVAAGGRIFKAFGHIAHKANQNAVLNTLMCINAYNGTILWRRELRSGLHDPSQHDDRHARRAVPGRRSVLQGDRCGIGRSTRRDRRARRHRPTARCGSGWPCGMACSMPWWAARRSRWTRFVRTSRGIGHWPWGMWKGHEYADPRTNFGFGRTLLAINPATKEVLWTYRDDDYLDSRGVCMNGGQIFFYSPEKFLGCLNIADGTLLWKNQDQDLLAGDRPQRPGSALRHRLRHADVHQVQRASGSSLPGRSAIDWSSPRPRTAICCGRRVPGNLQLVLRDDGFYCVGPQQGADDAGAKYSYDGQRLASLPMRRACTRATGSIDSIFYRAAEGTVRVNTASNTAEHIAPMRPPCQDGVIISDGLLFWGPWMCGCQLSLYGHVCLGPAGIAGHGRRGGTAVAASGGRCQRHWLHSTWRQAIGRPISTIVGAAVTRRSVCRSRCANVVLSVADQRICRPLRSWPAV